MYRLPTYAHYEITEACNLRCVHCFRFDVSDMPKANDLDEASTLNAIKILIENEIYSLTLTGGEPFARPETTLKALEIAKSAGLHVSINTNALLITPSIIKDLKQLKVDNLLVSCPAGNAEIYRKITRNGDYNKLKRNITLLVNENMSFLVNMVVSQTNFHLMRDTAIEMAKLGVQKFALTPVCLNVEYPDHKQLLSKSQTHELLETLRWCKNTLKLTVDSVEALPKCFYPSWCFEDNYNFTRRSCLAGGKSVSISNSGEVRPCSHILQSYGNIFSETLSDIWDKMREYRDNIIPNMCKDCPTLPQCKGSCRIYSIANFGVLNKPDRLAKGPTKLSLKPKPDITISDDTVLWFNGKLRSRLEKKNYYSIASRQNSSNILIVNDSMYKFVKWLSTSLPLAFSEISSQASKNSSREAQEKIIKSLIQNGFISIK